MLLKANDGLVGIDGLLEVDRSWGYVGKGRIAIVVFIQPTHFFERQGCVDLGQREEASRKVTALRHEGEPSHRLPFKSL